jgi:hypothetical protein
MAVSCFAMALDSAVVSSIKMPQQFENITQQIQIEIDAEVEQRVSQQRALIHNEAFFAVVKTTEALQLLITGNKDAAIKQLDKAHEKLNKLIDKGHTVQSEPVYVVILVNDSLTSYDEIQRRKQKIDTQWQLGHTQKVRYLLNSFVSDTSIRTLHMSVQQFAVEIKTINRLISGSELEKAKHLLQALLNSLAASEYTIPLPLFRAELMITKAEQLTQQVTNNEPVDVAQLYILLSNARYQLKLAEAFGYGDSKRYRRFFQAIKGIKSLVKANQQTVKLFSKLKYAILNLKNDVIEYK